MMLSDATIFGRLLINKVLPSGDVPILLMSIGEDYQADQKVSYRPGMLQSFVVSIRVQTSRLKRKFNVQRQSNPNCCIQYIGKES